MEGQNLPVQNACIVGEQSSCIDTGNTCYTGIGRAR